MFLSPGSRARGGLITPSYKLLNVITANNVATINDLKSFNRDGFSSFDIIYENVLPATNGTTMELQVYTAGAFQTSGYVSSLIYTSGAATATGNTTSFIHLSVTSNVQNSGAGNSGFARIHNPQSISTNKHVISQFCNVNSGNMYVGTAAGTWTTGTGAVTGFQMLFSSGNIVSGIFRVYGIT